MSDILKQIQALQEQFSNLFEVDDLGQPAMDVPPSQNKIKKDVKTKDGKAELVSVEDELFPYDGNKREQYRQKILDTINGMIQGTSTLEDLLQIVRQKKAPLKEAMELMENLINKRDQYHISKKSTADAEAEFKDSPLRHAQSLERMRFGYNNGKDDRKDVAKYRIGMHDGAKHQVHAYEPEYRCDSDTTPCDRAEETKNRIKRAHGADTLKEAVEILEGMINELYPGTVKSALHAHNKKTLELEDKVNKRIGEIFKKHGIKGNTYSAATAEDRQKAAETEKEIKEDPKIKDLHNQQEKRAKKNELYINAIRKARKSPVEEALEIMEAIINEVSERTKIDAYKKRANQSKLVGDIAKDTAKWHMDRGAYGPAIEVLKKADAAQKKEFKHRLNTMLHDKAFGQDAYNKAEKELRDEWKDKKDVKEALSLTEEIINEVSVGALARAVENNLPKRKKNEEAAIKAYKQAQNEYEKGSKESPEDEPALYKKLQCTDKAACKEFDKARDAENLKDLNLPKDSKVSANKLFNAAKKVNPERQKKTEETVKNTKGTKEDAKKFLNSLKRDNRSFDISLADPVKSRADEALEEALSLMEAIINELDYKFVSKQKANADKTLAKKVKAAEDEEEGKNKEAALDDVAKNKHKMNTTMDHVEQKRMNEIKTEEAKKNK